MIFCFCEGGKRDEKFTSSSALHIVKCDLTAYTDSFQCCRSNIKKKSWCIADRKKKELTSFTLTSATSNEMEPYFYKVINKYRHHLLLSGSGNFHVQCTE